MLAYPSGQLETRVDRVAVAILAVGATALNVLFSTSLTIIADKSTGLYGGLALATMTTVVIVRRWLIAPPRARAGAGAGPRRRARLPCEPDHQPRSAGSPTCPKGVEAILLAARDLAPAAIPIALLIGFYRQSERRLQALVDAIPDRMFRFARDGRYVDSNAADADDSDRRRTTGAGRPRWPSPARARCSPSPATEIALASAESALETGRLQAYDFSLDLPSGRRDFEARIAPSGPDEVTAIVRDFTDQRAVEAELRRSRARIVEATDEERRRLERDLHDGAQQRLVSLSLALRLLRERLDGRRRE